jgi:hypothetical protein
MRMEQKYIVRRRVAAVILLLAVIGAITYATRDVCYVGQPDGNWLGYGSCHKMIWGN